MGMRQRLGIAAALLGDPRVLVLDEPANGLDPPAIRWLRDMLRAQAAEGRAVLVSSHLLAEVAQGVDDVVVIARGELRARGTLEEVLGGGAPATVVRARDVRRLADGLAAASLRFEHARPDELVVHDAPPERVGEVAAATGRGAVAPLEPVALARGRVHGADRGGARRAAARTAGGAVAMGDLLRAELLKLRTTRTFFALVASAVGLSLLVVVLVTTIDDGFDAQDARDLLTIDASSLFILLLGAIGITGEWRHRTITSSLLAAPDRTRFLVAKLVAYAAAGAVLSIVVTLSVALVSTGILSARDETTVAFGDFVDVLWRNALVAALLGALGVAVGSLVRNQAGAIVLLLVMGFVIEPTVIGLEPDVGAWLPVGGAPAGINEPPDSEELLSPGLAVLAELGWIAGLGAIGALLLRRRDL